MRSAESRAIRTYPCSRIDSTCARISRVGPAQANNATISAIVVTSICRTYAEITTRIASVGMVSTVSDSVRITVSTTPPR